MQPRPLSLVWPILLWSFLAASLQLFAAPYEAIVGEVRVQVLSDTLVRLEVRGPKGFEDRPTFHVVNRDWPKASPVTSTLDGRTEIRAPHFIVKLPSEAKSLEQITVTSPDGTELYRYDGKLENSKWLPSPGDKPQAWWFADSPRMVPAPQGLTPAPDAAPDAGWDLKNDAPDIYVFLPRGDYRQLRSDFLKLTGPSELPPLYLFGAFDSRWYDYTEATGLAQIDDYRQHQIPLDVLVVDTGWRINASTGYQPNTNLFPDMSRFLNKAHEKNAKVLFNDHPEPLNKEWPALDARELNYRFSGLSDLLQQGLDVWWFDRNWHVSLVQPAPNLCKEVWGMKLYRDTTARIRPEERPLIMANVDGIDNGMRKRPMNVAAHRYTFQWTGDTGPSMEFLRRGVENAVHAGVESAFPYMSEDVGGHVADPTPEGYVRWIQYGTLSPVYRPHCTHNLQRMPWAFGAEAERITRNYVNLRYRLLPVFYAAARENYETGEPILRRLDLEFPDQPEAKREDQYLLGHDLLIAPVLAESVQPLPAAWLKTADGQPGLKGEYFTNDQLSGEPAVTRTDATVDFRWENGSPDKKIPTDHFTARWTGTVQLPAEAGEQTLSATSDDGVRVWVDDQLVIDNWKANDSVARDASGTLKPGAAHKLRVEYLEVSGRASIQLRARAVKSTEVQRELWLPPGEWIDAWSGRVLHGPQLTSKMCPLGTTPIYVRSGAVVVLAPEMQFTGEKPWSPLTLDYYLSGETTNIITLYEDDGHSTAYQRGKFRKIEISAAWTMGGYSRTITIGAAKGSYPGALEERTWKLRLHMGSGINHVSVRLNDKQLPEPVRLPRNPSAMPLGDPSGAPDGDVFEVSLPSVRVDKAQTVDISF